jgi:uncharacterized protein YqjF (DUF2071 family)
MKVPPTDHRPWPIPRSPWVMAQTWSDLLFAHWPIPVDILRPLVPVGLNIDSYNGTGWVGVVPFQMSGVRPRWVPPLRQFSVFPELNVRTYVTLDGKPGVYFFSLEAGNPIAVAVARGTFHLPYFNAQMTRQGTDSITYSSVRTHAGAPEAEFQATYRPIGGVFEVRPGSLEDFLTARYCLYSVDKRGRLYRGEIHHVPWPLQPAAAIIQKNTMAAAHQITLPERGPLLHFVKRIDVVVWAISRAN